MLSGEINLDAFRYDFLDAHVSAPDGTTGKAKVLRVQVEESLVVAMIFRQGRDLDTFRKIVAEMPEPAAVELAGADALGRLPSMEEIIKNGRGRP